MLNAFLSQRCDVGEWCATVACAKTLEKCASVARHVRTVRYSVFIMVLEREAPQADLSKETCSDVCAVTLRTASGTSAEVIWTL